MNDLSNKTRALRAVAELRKKILNGELPGGKRIFEVPLAEEFKISRTPIREAMSRLAEEGLLDRAPNGGFQVRTFLVEDIIDAIELRGVLEGTAVRLGIEREPTPAQIDALKACLGELDTCFGTAPATVDVERYADLNAQFHRLLAALPRSETIKREVERATKLPFASPSAFLPNKSYLGHFHESLFVAQDQHTRLVDAICKGEAGRAEFLAREHARSARRNLEHLLISSDTDKLKLSEISLLTT